MLIRSGEAPGIGWSRSMLYSGFITLPRSVSWSAYLNGRSDNADVICLMQLHPKFSIRFLIALTLLCAVGVAIWLAIHRTYVVVEIPRPNSGAYSSPEAKKLLPGFLNKTAGINPDNEIIQNWKGRTQSVHVHVDRDGGIRSICVGIEYLSGGPIPEFHTARLGLDGLETTMGMQPRWGNQLSVLMTSDTDGWHGPAKQSVIDTLFTPSVQIYTVNQTGK